MPKVDVDELADKVMTALEDDDPEKALKLVEKALKDAPDDPELLVLKSEAELQLDDVEAAVETLEHAVKKHPDEPNVLLAAAGFSIEIEEDDHERVELALRRLEKAEKLAKKRGDRELEGDVARMAGAGHRVLGELAESAAAFERARKLLGDEDPTLLFDVATSWVDVLRFEDARRLLTELVAADPEDPDAHHYLGLCFERLGDEKNAERHFERARKLDPEEYPKPVHLTQEEFEDAIEKALAAMPEKVREKLANVPILVEDLPKLEDLRDPPLSPLSVGMFRGRNIREESVSDATPAFTSIVLYQRNLERHAATKDDLVAEIEDTLVHEVGHFVGWDEEDLHERGLE